VSGRIAYVRNNPVKEGIPAQEWEFLKSFVGPRSFIASAKGKQDGRGLK